MSQLSPADVKPHLVLPVDFVGDDTLIQSYLDAAEDRVQKHIRRDLDTEYPDGWPENILQAVRFLVAFYYQHRGDGEVAAGLPEPVTDMLAPERNLAG